MLELGNNLRIVPLNWKGGGRQLGAEELIRGLSPLNWTGGGEGKDNWEPGS